MKGAARATITPDCYIPTKRLFQELRSGHAGSIRRFIFDRGFRVTRAAVAASRPNGGHAPAAGPGGGMTEHVSIRRFVVDFHSYRRKI